MANETINGTLFVTDKIGIGINEPNEPIAQLHILSSTVAPSQAYLESGGVLLNLSVDGTGASIGTANAFPLSIQTDGSSRISINRTGDITTTGALTVQNNLLVTGNVGIGTSTASTAKLEVNGTVKVNSLQIGALSVQSVSSGTPPTNTLQVNGAVKATSFQGNGAALDGIVKKVGDIMTGPLTVQNNLTVTGNVGIGTTEPQGKLDVRGAIHAGNSDIYFTKTDHNHTAFGNTIGLAAIENAADFGALMILGRSNPPNSRRIVKLWDYLQVNGDLDVTGNINGRVSIPSGQLSFGAQTRQMINLWPQVYGIGVQNYTQYFRTDEHFAWFKKGIHSDTAFNPGSGGSRLMALNNAGDLILSARTNPEADPNKSACRALVDLNQTLAINFANDYTNGVYIDGTVRFGGSIVRWGNNSALQSDQGGSIELGGDSSTPGSGTPYIDFHFAGLTQDFNTRIINDANGRLSLVANQVFVTGSLRQNSSRQIKKNIKNLTMREAFQALKELNPVKFSYKNDHQENLHLGFIAEDVPDLLSADDKSSIGSLDIVAVLTKVVQEQQTTISTLTEKVESLERQSHLWQVSQD